MLQRGLLVFDQDETLARGGEFAFEVDDALAGGIEMFLDGAARFARGTALGRFLFELPFELGDVRLARLELLGGLVARAFERAACLAGELEIAAQARGVRIELRRLALDLVELAAQFVIGRALLLEAAGERQGLRLLGLERAQGGIEGQDQPVEGLLEVVELADLAAGVGQEVAQHFVLFADARPGIDRRFAGGRLALGIATQWHGWQRDDLVGAALRFAAENVRQLRHVTLPELTLRSHEFRSWYRKLTYYTPVPM